MAVWLVGLFVLAIGLAALSVGIFLDPVVVGERNCGHNGTLGVCDEQDDALSEIVPWVVGVPITLAGLLVLLAAARPQGAVVNLRPWRR